MTDQHPKPPIVNPSPETSSPPDRQEHCPGIVQPTMTDRSGARGDGLVDDDEQWISTVVASLEGRSVDVKEALMKALENGGEQRSTDAIPSPAPVFPNSTGICQKPSDRRSPAIVVYTKRLHYGALDGVSNPRKCSLTHSQSV